MARRGRRLGVRGRRARGRVGGRVRWFDVSSNQLLPSAIYESRSGKAPPGAPFPFAALIAPPRSATPLKPALPATTTTTTPNALPPRSMAETAEYVEKHRISERLQEATNAKQRVARGPVTPPPLDGGGSVGCNDTGGGARGDRRARKARRHAAREHGAASTRRHIEAEVLQPPRREGRMRDGAGGKGEGGGGGKKAGPMEAMMRREGQQGVPAAGGRRWMRRRLETPRQQAVEGGHLPIVKLLHSRAPTNAKAARDPLWCAAEWPPHTVKYPEKAGRQDGPVRKRPRRKVREEPADDLGLPRPGCVGSYAASCQKSRHGGGGDASRRATKGGVDDGAGHGHVRESNRVIRSCLPTRRSVPRGWRRLRLDPTDQCFGAATDRERYPAAEMLWAGKGDGRGVIQIIVPVAKMDSGQPEGLSHKRRRRR